MAYFGDTMAHSALLGIAFGFLLDINLSAGVFVIVTLCSLILVSLQKRGGLPADTVLGILSHSTLALGFVAVSFMTTLRIDLLGYLFGDILAVSRMDIGVIYAGGVAVLALLTAFWRSLIAATVSEELAHAEGMNPQGAQLVFMLIMAGVVAVAMKIVGILLITSLLIIPAATARRFSRNPEHMAVLAAIFGTMAVVAGLFGSLQWDTPSGPTIAAAALGFFVVSLMPVAASIRFLTGLE